MINLSCAAYTLGLQNDLLTEYFSYTHVKNRQLPGFDYFPPELGLSYSSPYFLVQSGFPPLQQNHGLLFPN